MQRIYFHTIYAEHIVFLSTLSPHSNSLTRCQREDSLSHGWRIESVYVILRNHPFKALRKTYVQILV